MAVAASACGSVLISAGKTVGVDEKIHGAKNWTKVC